MDWMFVSSKSICSMPKVTLFGYRAFKEVIKVKCSLKGSSSFEYTPPRGAAGACSGLGDHHTVSWSTCTILANTCYFLFCFDGGLISDWYHTSDIIWYVSLSLTDFPWYDNLWVHPCCCKWHGLFFFVAEWYSIVCICPIFFIHLCVGEQSGCFRVLAVVNSAAVNIGVHVSFQIRIVSGYMPRSGTAG